MEFAGPDADNDVVVYSNLSHSDDVYDNFLVIFVEKFKVVDPTPEHKYYYINYLQIKFLNNYLQMYLKLIYPV